MFCSAQETIKLLLSCDNLGGLVGFTPLDRDLRSHFDHPPRRDLEVVVGGAAEADEQQVLPARGMESDQKLEQKLRKIDEQGRLSCLWPLNLFAPPQTDNCRGIALSGFSAAPPSIIRLGGAVCIGGLL
jgi:hypothetical protein